MSNLFNIALEFFSSCCCSRTVPSMEKAVLSGFVENFIGVPAFSCSSISDNCIFVRPKTLGLLIEHDKKWTKVYWLNAMTEESSGTLIPGVYINYHPLFSGHVNESGSYFYSKSWLREAKRVECNKVVMVPTEFVLKPCIINPSYAEQFFGLGLKPVSGSFYSENSFPVVA